MRGTLSSLLRETGRQWARSAASPEGFSPSGQLLYLGRTERINVLRFIYVNPLNYWFSTVCFCLSAGILRALEGGLASFEIIARRFSARYGIIRIKTRVLEYSGRFPSFRTILCVLFYITYYCPRVFSDRPCNFLFFNCFVEFPGWILRGMHYLMPRAGILFYANFARPAVPYIFCEF